jgi:hypothetical protein
MINGMGSNAGYHMPPKVEHDIRVGIKGGACLTSTARCGRHVKARNEKVPRLQRS